MNKETSTRVSCLRFFKLWAVINGLHEGMRKEASVSACPECVESMSLMWTKWPEQLSNHSGH